MPTEPTRQQRRAEERHRQKFIEHERKFGYATYPEAEPEPRIIKRKPVHKRVQSS